MKNISRTIENLIADVSNVPLQQLFENIICNAGVLGYIMKNEEKMMKNGRRMKKNEEEE